MKPKTLSECIDEVADEGLLSDEDIAALRARLAELEDDSIFANYLIARGMCFPKDQYDYKPKDNDE